MRSFIVLLVIGTALFACAEDNVVDVHKTTVRVTPGIISKLLGSKPTSISLDGNGNGSGNKKQKKPALLSYYPLLADYPEQYPGKYPEQQKNPDPYTFLPQKPFYPSPQQYPQPYPLPYPVPYPQPSQSLPPQIPPYPQYPGYPPFYPGIQSYPQYPVYPNYPPPIYPSPYPYPSGYPGRPGYPIFSEPSEESGSGSGSSSSQKPDQIGEIVTNPELASEPSDIDNEENDVRQTKPAPMPELMASSVPVASSMPMSLPSSMPLPSSIPMAETVAQ